MQNIIIKGIEFEATNKAITWLEQNGCILRNADGDWELHPNKPFSIAEVEFLMTSLND